MLGILQAVRLQISFCQVKAGAGIRRNNLTRSMLRVIRIGGRKQKWKINRFLPTPEGGVGLVLSRVGRVLVFCFRPHFVWDIDYDNNGVGSMVNWIGCHLFL